MNPTLIESYSRYESRLSAQRERTANKVVAGILALLACWLMVGALDAGVAWQTQAVPQIAHGGLYVCGEHYGDLECEQLYGEE